MDTHFAMSDISTLFPSEESCLEEIKKLRYPKGVFCTQCDRVTKHYKIAKRKSYACGFCRNHISPLSGTIFDKTTTPLRLWFYAMLLMATTRGDLSAKKLQKELCVTYKTAWRMHRRILTLMQQDNGDLLAQSQVFSWTIFNTFEFKVTQKNEETS